MSQCIPKPYERFCGDVNVKVYLSTLGDVVKK